jgi:hypothetical protein
VLTGSAAPAVGLAAIVSAAVVGGAAALSRKWAHTWLRAMPFVFAGAAAATVVVERSWFGVCAVAGAVVGGLVAVAARRAFAPLARLSAAHRAMLYASGGAVTPIEVAGGMDTVVFENGKVAVVASVAAGDTDPAEHPEVARFAASAKRLLVGAGIASIPVVCIVDTASYGPTEVGGAVVCSPSTFRKALDRIGR